MKPRVLAGIIVAVLIGVGALVFVVTQEDTQETVNNSSQSPNNTAAETRQNNESSNSNANETQVAEGLTLSEVALHSTASDCWTVIEGSVYDLTAYIPRHPGGDDILLACGGDGTSLFMSRTTEDGEAIGSGEPHSSKAQSQLAQYKIGDLNQ